MQIGEASLADTRIVSRFYDGTGSCVVRAACSNLWTGGPVANIIGKSNLEENKNDTDVSSNVG
jgi:hypothetical protein